MAGRIFGRASASGSSPRMRGLFCCPPHSRSRSRFIPAHAGLMYSSTKRTKRTTVHPRVCGAYHRLCRLFRSVNGSSPRVRGLCKIKKGRDNMDGSFPRMRGLLQGSSGCAAATRFIPAHAGLIHMQPQKPPCWCGSSPRMRGLLAHALGKKLADGSSPRMRGL